MNLYTKTQSTLTITALFCLLSFSGASQAMRLTGSCPNGDMNSGMSDSQNSAIKKLADDECSSCHGIDGNGVRADDDVPYLAGQNFKYLCAWLDACRTQGKNCDSHEDIADRLSDRDIVGLANFYTHLPSNKWLPQ